MEDGQGRELQAPRYGCLEEQHSLSQGQGPALPGDGEAGGLSPSLGKPVAQKSLNLPQPHRGMVTHAPEPTPVLQEPGLVLGKVGGGTQAKQCSTLCPHSLSPGLPMDCEGGMQLRQSDVVLLWQSRIVRNKIPRAKAPQRENTKVLI